MGCSTKVYENLRNFTTVDNGLVEIDNSENECCKAETKSVHVNWRYQAISLIEASPDRGPAQGAGF
jgi:hypothetical protein